MSRQNSNLQVSSANKLIEVSVYKHSGTYLRLYSSVNGDPASEHNIELITEVSFIENFRSLLKLLNSHQLADILQLAVILELLQEFIVLTK